MKEMTLREVCEVTKVSRRAIQGYEKEKLVCAKGKNPRGYLLYDEKSIKRIEQIKLYQQMGFKLKEIKDIIDAPRNELKKVLILQAEKLKEDIYYLFSLHKIFYSLFFTVFFTPFYTFS